jgi:hypothetical protein
MSDRGNSREYAEWVYALVDLLRGFQQLPDYEVAFQLFREPQSRVERQFRNRGCLQYADWLIDRNVDPPTNPPPELEEVALRAVIEALDYVPRYGPYFSPDGKRCEVAPEKRQELGEKRRQVIRLAQDRLDELEGKGAGVPPEWEGDDWEELEPLVKRLLLFMHDRAEADLQELCPLVWGEDCADVSESARSTAISKANSFLRKRESNRLLRQVRRGNRLRWDEHF